MLLAFTGYLRRSMPGGRWFIFLLLAAAHWAYFEALSLSINDENYTLLFDKIKLMGSQIVAPLWFSFVIAYTNKEHHLTLYRQMALWIIPLAGILLGFTSDFNHLLFINVETISRDGRLLLLAKWGIWGKISTIYAYILISSSLMILIYTLIFSLRRYRLQIGLLLASCIIPFMFDIIGNVKISDSAGIDFTPLAFSISGVLLALNIFSMKLFDVVPVAYQKLFQSMNHGVIVLDADRQIIDMNHVSKKLLGGNQLKIGEPVTSLEFLKQRAEAVFNRQKEIMTDFHLTDNYWISLTTTPLYFKKNVFAGYLCIIQDISLRKRAEEQIRKNSEQLKKLNDDKDKFFSIIAHDLKSPFQFIKGYIDLLQNDYELHTDLQRKQLLQGVDSAVDSSLRLLNNLLDWGMIQTEKLVCNPGSTDVKLLCIELLEQFSGLAEKKGIALQLVSEQIAEAFCDENMVSAILRNLVSNAHKFTRPGGKITISYQGNNGEVRIIIQDNGVGIPQQKLERLFKVSEKVSTPGTLNETGTGLGLILCKELALLNRGDVLVESKEGEGSTFILILPSKN